MENALMVEEENKKLFQYNFCLTFSSFKETVTSGLFLVILTILNNFYLSLTVFCCLYILLSILTYKEKDSFLLILSYGIAVTFAGLIMQLLNLLFCIAVFKEYRLCLDYHLATLLICHTLLLLISFFYRKTKYFYQNFRTILAFIFIVHGVSTFHILPLICNIFLPSGNIGILIKLLVKVIEGILLYLISDIYIIRNYEVSDSIKFYNQ